MDRDTPPPALGQRLLDNLSGAVLLFGPDLRLRYINPAGEMLFKLSARHLLNQSADELLPCPGGHLSHKLEKVMRSAQPITDRELELPLHDGTRVKIACTAQALPDEGQGPEILVELTQLDRQLRISREEHLLSQQRATQSLIRGLAHEVKNPLGGLRGAAQLLESELPDPGLREYTRIIIEEADRLQALMDRMLGPNRPRRRERVNIHQVLERVRTLVEAETGLAVATDYDPSLPPVCGDLDRLIQALLNIARNGARAAGPDGHLIFATRAQRQFTIGDHHHRLVLRVEIRDDGPGIPPELQERIFLPMVTGEQGGTGLGLTIAQTLVNQHDGLIECQSEPGDTRFHVYLPFEGDHGC